MSKLWFYCRFHRSRLRWRKPLISMPNLWWCFSAIKTTKPHYSDTENSWRRMKSFSTMTGPFAQQRRNWSIAGRMTKEQEERKLHFVFCGFWVAFANLINNSSFYSTWIFAVWPHISFGALLFSHGTRKINAVISGNLTREKKKIHRRKEVCAVFFFVSVDEREKALFIQY